MQWSLASGAEKVRQPLGVSVTSLLDSTIMFGTWNHPKFLWLACEAKKMPGDIWHNVAVLLAMDHEKGARGQLFDRFFHVGKPASLSTGRQPPSEPGHKGIVPGRGKLVNARILHVDADPAHHVCQLREVGWERSVGHHCIDARFFSRSEHSGIAAPTYAKETDQPPLISRALANTLEGCAQIE